MKSDDLLHLLGVLAREEEERIEARWDAIAADTLSEPERAELEGDPWTRGDLVLVKHLAEPLSREETERIWESLQAIGRAERPAPK